MAEFVEGEWKNFVFKMGTPDKYPLIFEQLRSVFCRDEPLNKMAGYSEEFADDIERFARYYMDKNEGLTFYVEEKDTGKVAGVRITSSQKKGDPEPNFPINSDSAKRVLGVLGQVADGGSVFEKYGVDTYGYFLMTCVDPAFRGQGLVTEIYRRSIALLKAKGYPACASLFSSPFTRKAATNLGFDLLFNKKVLDCKDEAGNLLIPNAGEDDSCSLMSLRL
jgi:ribosomal protein S18 acetylase RimI-like enzyme